MENMLGADENGELKGGKKTVLPSRSKRRTLKPDFNLISGADLMEKLSVLPKKLNMDKQKKNMDKQIKSYLSVKIGGGKSKKKTNKRKKTYKKKKTNKKKKTYKKKN